MGRIPTVPLERQTWADGLVLGHPVATVEWTKGAPDAGGGNIAGSENGILWEFEQVTERHGQVVANSGLPGEWELDWGPEKD